jgi:hypothetical protein
VFPSQSPRVSASIRTDQSFYKPGQMIQVEVLLFNAFTKVPITITRPDQANLNLILILEIYNQANQRIFSNYETLDKNTASFSFMIPESAEDGDYQIRVLSPVIPETLRTFRVFRPS